MIDLTGQTFGTLTVQRYESGRWLCTCAEGHEVLRTRDSLKRNVPCDHCEAKRLNERTKDLHDRYVVKRQSLGAIADAYDVDLKTAWAWVRRAGIKTRSRGAPTGSRGKYAVLRAEAVRRVAAGECISHVERALGIAQGTAWRWCVKDGVKAKIGRPRKVDPAVLVDASLTSLHQLQAAAPTPRDRVLDLHAQGVGRKTIAHDLGLSVATVGRWIADADRERIARIRAMVADGVPHEAIAEAFGVSRAYVGLLAREGRERAA